jgi:hypothetical protein
MITVLKFILKIMNIFYIYVFEISHLLLIVNLKIHTIDNILKYMQLLGYNIFKIEFNDNGFKNYIKFSSYLICKTQFSYS